MRTIAARLVASVLLGLLVSSLLTAAQAQIGVPHATQSTPRAWKSVGPAPPSIPAAIAAHAPSHTIYIGSLGGGVLKSTDGGATFTAFNNGVSPTVTSMVMDPNDPNVV